MNIGEYLTSRTRGKCSPKFTELEANNCFNIIFPVGDVKNYKITSINMEKTARN